MGNVQVRRRQVGRGGQVQSLVALQQVMDVQYDAVHADSVPIGIACMAGT